MASVEPLDSYSLLYDTGAPAFRIHVLDKINELVDAHNILEGKLDLLTSFLKSVK